jgi:hypothetical protein
LNTTALFDNLKSTKVEIYLEKYVIHYLNFVKSAYLHFFRVEGGVKFMKLFKGGASCKSLGTSQTEKDGMSHMLFIRIIFKYMSSVMLQCVIKANMFLLFSGS